eukprot:1377843-Pleurochrysis_carterae.AAC.1
MKAGTTRAETSKTSNESPRSSVGEAARIPCATSVDDRGESGSARMLAASRTARVRANEGGAAPSAEEGGGSKPLILKMKPS